LVKDKQTDWYPFNLNRNINRESGSYFEGIDKSSRALRYRFGRFAAAK